MGRGLDLESGYNLPHACAGARWCVCVSGYVCAGVISVRYIALDINASTLMIKCIYIIIYWQHIEWEIGLHYQIIFIITLQSLGYIDTHTLYHVQYAMYIV